MVKPKTFEIKLNKEVYYGGETLQGYVNIVLKDDMKCDAIKIIFHGMSRVRWSEGSSDYSGNENYFKEKIFVHGSATDTSSHILPKGTYRYPFSYQLPQLLPASYQDEIGHVRYQVKCKIKRKWKFNHVIYSPFTVISSALPDTSAPAPVVNHESKKVKFMFKSKGTVDATLRLDKTVYTPGSSIPIFAEVFNGTKDRRMTTYITFIRTLTYFASSREKTDVTKTKKIQHEAMAPGDSDIWYGDLLQIPSDAIPNLHYCNTINITYKVSLKVKPCDLKVETEITIVSPESKPPPPPSYKDVMMSLNDFQLPSTSS